MGTSSAYILANLANSQGSGPSPLSAYPITNAWDGKAYRPVRWSSSSVTIRIDAVGACDGVSLCNHNLKTGAAVTITPGAGSPISITPKTGLSIWCKFPSAASSATIAISNSEGVSIGEIVMGSLTVLAKQFSYGHGDNHEYTNEVRMTDGGAVLAFEKYNGRVISLPYNAISDAVRDQIRELYAATKGGLTPFLFIPDTSANDCVYGRIGGIFKSSSASYRLWNSAVEIREEVTAALIA